MSQCYQLNDSWRTYILREIQNKNSFQDKVAYLYAVCHRVYPLFHEGEGVPPCPESLILGKTDFWDLTKKADQENFDNNIDFERFFEKIGVESNSDRNAIHYLLCYIKLTEKYAPVSNGSLFANWMKLIERFKNNPSVSTEFSFVKDCSFDYSYDSTAGSCYNFLDNLDDYNLNQLWIGYPRKK